MAAGVIRSFSAVVLLGAVAGAVGSGALSPGPNSISGILGDSGLEGVILSAAAWASASGVPTAIGRRKFDPYLDLEVPDLIQYWGYPAERHWVTTEDGYILGMHRIPRGRLDVEGQPRPVALLGQPLLSSSAEWVILGPGRSLAFLLAEEGYDVWLLNLRGNTYSRNHTHLSPNQDEFWDFSFHEHGYYDLPAAINYTLRSTGQRSLQYVGFSMGTALMWIMGSTRPEWLKPLRLVTALGPVSAITHTRSRTALLVLRFFSLFSPIFRSVHYNEVMPHTTGIQWLAETFCSDGQSTQKLCSGLLALLGGSNPPQLNSTILPMIVARAPAGTSMKNMLHFSQSLSGFRQYDYGPRANMIQYGSTEPPAYNLSLFTAPVRMYYGLNDQLTDWKDVLALKSKLPNVLSCRPVPDPKWTHLDFAWARDVHKIVFPQIIADMKMADVIAERKERSRHR